MNTPALPLTLSLAALLAANVLAQDSVQIQFQTDPVLVQTGTNAVFTVQTVSQVLSLTWSYQGTALGLWAGGNSVVETVPQFQGRVTITNTQLRVGSTQLRDAGTYAVEVIPSPSTGLAKNSRSIQLRVFDAVDGVSLTVPTVAVEGGNVSLSCAWTAGTETTVQWGKGGAAITADSRINISGGSLVINPARRGDAGEYTCTVSNPVSAQTATRSLTVYYGPDTPVLTKESPKDCIGNGDVLVGQKVVLTCTSDSLPPATFTWQRAGQTVTTGQPGSGVLSLQTLSTDESGRYVCTATNSITTGTSEQGTDLAVVDICLDGGEVAGIVIGCFLLIIIIALLIALIVFLVRRRRVEQRERETVLVQKSNPNTRPVPPDPLPNGARDLGQGPHPPLYHLNTHTRHQERLYAEPRESRGNSQTLPLNGLRNSDTHQHNGHTHTNRLLHDSIHNNNSIPHNGIDNPAFTHTDAQNANTLPNSQHQNPNILIQTGTAQGGTQPAAVHVSLNGQSNNTAPPPTIHVNLNSYPTNGPQTQQDSSFPFTNTANNNLQTQQNLINTDQSSPRLQGGQSYRADPRANGFIEAGYRDQPGLIPTGFTHYNPSNTSQRNARTQTNPQDLEPRSRSAANSTGRHETTTSSSHHQRPWDLLQGTPAYPSGTFPRRQPAPEYTSDTDYTTHPPIRETRTPNRSRPESRATSRSRATPRRDIPSLDRERRSRSADLRGPNTRSLFQLEDAHHTQRSPRTQRERAQRDIRGSPGSQSAPRQEATHSNNPQALPLMSQQASVGRSAVSQGPMTQLGLTVPQGADTRALADPNHLPQAHMAQQQRAAPIQKTPQGLGTQRQPVIDGANHIRQGGTAPVPHTPAQHNPSNLTQAALSAHTQRAQTFQSRNQQTQAALLNPGPQAGAEARQPPAPPPVIPLAQFQTLPEKRSQHRSPIRGPQPPRPPVNVPVAQRHSNRHNLQHHPANHHHHHPHHHQPGHGHTHVGVHRHAQARGPGNPAHFTHPRQQQTHKERPR